MKSFSDPTRKTPEEQGFQVQSWEFADLVDPADDIPEDNFELSPTAVTLTSPKTESKVEVWQPGTIKQYTPANAYAPVLDEAFEEGVSQEENKVISQIEEQLNQAEATLRSARSQADEIIRNAELEFERQKEAGYQQGLENARTETLKNYNEVKKLVADTYNWHKEIINTAEEVVIDLVVEISRKLFSSGFNLDRKVLHQAYARAIAEAKSLGDLRIHVNPSDEITIDPQWTNQIISFTGQEIEWVPNQNILPGGCLIEGQFGSVDARIESQLATLLDLIENTLQLEE